MEHLLAVSEKFVNRKSEINAADFECLDEQLALAWLDWYLDLTSDHIWKYTQTFHSRLVNTSLCKLSHIESHISSIYLEIQRLASPLFIPHMTMSQAQLINFQEVIYYKIYPYLVHQLAPMLLVQLESHLRNSLTGEENEEGLNTIHHFEMSKIIEGSYIGMLQSVLEEEIENGELDFQESLVQLHLHFLIGKVFPMLSLIPESERLHSWQQRLEFFVYRSCSSKLYI